MMINNTDRGAKTMKNQITKLIDRNFKCGADEAWYQFTRALDNTELTLSWVSASKVLEAEFGIIIDSVELEAKGVDGFWAVAPE